MAAVTPINPISPLPKTSRPIELKSTLSWHKKPLSRAASYVPEDKKSWWQKLLSKTIGQVAGGAVSLLSVGSIVYSLFFKRGEGSIWTKYVLPVVTTIAGFIGLKVSKPPEDAFTADLLRAGMKYVFDKVRDLKKIQNELPNIAKLFSDKKDEAKSKMDDALVEAMPVIKRFLPSDYEDTELLTKLREIPYDNSLQPLIDLVKEHNTQVSAFLATNPEFVRNVVTSLSNNNRFKEKLNTLKEWANEILKITGIKLDFEYDKAGNEFKVYFLTADLFSDPSRKGENFNPYFRIPVKPEKFYNALKIFSERIKSMTPLIEKFNEAGEQENLQLRTKVTSQIFIELNNASNELVNSFDEGRIDILRSARLGYKVLDSSTGACKDSLFLDLEPQELLFSGYFPLLELFKFNRDIGSKPLIKREAGAGAVKSEMLEAKENSSGVPSDDEVTTAVE